MTEIKIEEVSPPGWTEHVMIKPDGTGLRIAVDPISEMSLQAILDGYRAQGVGKVGLLALEIMYVTGYRCGQLQRDGVLKVR